MNQQKGQTISDEKFARILQEEIDKQIIEELIEIFKKSQQEDYDRAMKGI